MTQPQSGSKDSAHFCPNCGVVLSGAECRNCHAELNPGAKFCHRCGATAPTATGARFGRMGPNAVPWGIAAIALVAVVGLVAAQRFGRVDTAAGALPAEPPTGVMAAPDISSLTPAQRAERLYDRVMSAAERGRTDSVQFFMSMAIGAYRALGELNADQRYDLGRLGDVSGNAALATAQADTILRKHPQHLLGLILAARAAQMRGDGQAARRYFDRLLSAERGERQKQLPEYLVHQNDIDTALREARPASR